MFKHDVCANRHGGNAMSVAANRRAAPGKQEMKERVVACLRRMGRATGAQIAAMLDVPHNFVSGRITELKRDGIVREVARDGRHGILRVVEHAEGVQGRLFEIDEQGEGIH